MHLLFLLNLFACSEYGLKGTDRNDGGNEPRDTSETTDDSGDHDNTTDTLDSGRSCALTPSSGEVAVDDTCRVDPPEGAFDPVVEWQWSESEDWPAYVQIMATPVVAELDDDDGDGDVDTDDVPDIVFTAFAGTSYGSAGTLNAIEGDGSGTLWTRYEFGGAYHVFGSAPPAIGDIDGDGEVEICAAGVEVAVVCVHADGSFAMAGGTEAWYWGGPAIHDIDGDGDAEVIYGRQVIDHAGAVVWTGSGGVGSYLSLAVDVDGDAGLEVVAGNTLYDTDGTLLWTNSSIYDGFPAAGDFDGDGLPEILSSIYQFVNLLDADGTLIWQATVPGGGGGPPTVADFDNDGEPEVGVAGSSYYVVFDTDGSLLWQMPIQDYSSSQTGSSVFDFEGDGYADVVYADEVTLWVFDGATGEVKLQEDGHASCTLYEYPVIVDVDNDGSAEIVLASNNQWFDGWTGITVIGDAEDRWRPASPIWNQFAWYITNVNQDGTIPAVPDPPWDEFNTFRAGGTDLGLGYELADMGPGEPEICTDECRDGVVWALIPVWNTGTSDTSDFTVQVLNGDDAVLWSETVALASGVSEQLGPVEITEDQWVGELRVVVNAEAEVEECDPDDDVVSMGTWPCDE